MRELIVILSELDVSEVQHCCQTSVDVTLELGEGEGGRGRGCVCVEGEDGEVVKNTENDLVKVSWNGGEDDLAVV